jgi:predicted Zn finger-like uncharacterized protein
MLVPNLTYHAMRRLQLGTAVLPNYIVHLAAGIPCPACGTEIRVVDAEETDDGVRIICHSCHRDLFVIEESHS